MWEECPGAAGPAIEAKAMNLNAPLNFTTNPPNTLLLLRIFFAKNFWCLLGAHSNAKKKSKETVMSYQRSHVKPASQRWAKRYSRMRCPILMVGWYISVHQVVIQLHIYTSETGSPTNLFRLWGRQGLSQSSELYAGIYLYIYLISRFVCTYIYIHNYHIYYILY